MNRVRMLLREPALLIDLGETLVIFLVAWGVTWDKEQQGYLVAAIIALVGLAKAFTTTPFPVTALTDATRAVMVVIASVFGVGLSADQIALTATLVGTVFTLIARAQITPVKDPVTAARGAGGGPVSLSERGEAGYTEIGIVGLVIVVVGVLLLLGVAFEVVKISLVWPIVIIVVGLVVWLMGSRSRL